MASSPRENSVCGLGHYLSVPFIIIGALGDHSLKNPEILELPAQDKEAEAS